MAAQILRCSRWLCACDEPCCLSQPDVFDIAAGYAFGIAKAHAFVDGNKRTAFVACFTFLRLKGCNLRPEPKEGVRMMEELASSVVSETSFASWLRAMAQKSASEA